VDSHTLAFPTEAESWNWPLPRRRLSSLQFRDRVTLEGMPAVESYYVIFGV
jgi:hypothetical protein